MKKRIIILGFWGMVNTAFAQKHIEKKDSAENLDSVTVVGILKKNLQTDMKMNVSVDEYLSSSDQVSFVKRGAYAWEPLLNNMGTERTSITIDGMHIFGACTDKMDPVTSYVESNNLSSIDIKSGQAGSMHGATIGGSIDMKRKTTPFGRLKKWDGAFTNGFEWNNRQYFTQGNASYSGEKFVADAGISFRKAGNYSDGKGDEVKHSQYNKFNTSVGLAYKTGPLSSLRADAIFDMARNVGYPALPMDLWLSRAIITSLSYKQLFEKGIVRAWETKMYFNAIEHYMDDTKRPENLVHMDMPGWSTTYGLLSAVHLQQDRYTSDIELNTYDNLSIAEMRMYPQDRSKETMFAYSWPWVTTRFAGLSIDNHWELSDISQLNVGGSLGVNYNRSKYVEFNRIFHPNAPQDKTRLLPALHASYQLDIDCLNFSVGTGYGHRAPSVSEGYGYYIYNSFDRYDYVGNPDLKNEISYEGNASAGFKKDRYSFSARVNYFYIKNYIIGQILSIGSPMNYQSVGVKSYISLDHATLLNFSVNAGYDILKDLHWEGTLIYARGRDYKGENLPFIRPLNYRTMLHYHYKKIGVQVSLNGDFTQTHFSPEYGEDETPAYDIWNMSADYGFKISRINAVFQIGAENLLNRYYSTYADWGNIPRMGRNIFTSLKLNF